MWETQTFVITEEHIRLLQTLNVKFSAFTWYGDIIVPRIDEKRPFGNSGVTYDVIQRLGLTDEDGNYTTEAELHALTVLAELPLAYSLIMRDKDFTPRTCTFEKVDFITEVHQVKAAKDIILLRDFLQDCKKQVSEDIFEELISELYSNFSNSATAPIEDIGERVEGWKKYGIIGETPEIKSRIANLTKVWEIYKNYKEKK